MLSVMAESETHQSAKMGPYHDYVKSSSYRIKAIVLMCGVSSNRVSTDTGVIQTASAITRLGNTVWYTRKGVGTGGVVGMCTGEVVRGQFRRALHCGQGQLQTFPASLVELVGLFRLFREEL